MCALICGDFKLTVNRALRLDHYPILKIEDLLVRLSGGKTFMILDMSQAYQQLLLDEESKQYVIVNTPKGLFMYNSLPFGVSSAPEIFQRVMESILRGIPGVVVNIDDILVTGKTEADRLAALKEVLLAQLRKAGLRLKNKYEFMQLSVKCLGYKIDAEGVQPIKENVKQFKRPQFRRMSQSWNSIWVSFPTTEHSCRQYWHHCTRCYVTTPYGVGHQRRKPRLPNRRSCSHLCKFWYTSILS